MIFNMEERMLQHTRNYAKDYERTGKKGEVRYIGRHYRFSLEAAGLKRIKICYALLLFAALGLYAAVGVSGSAAFGGAGTPAAFYVALPYVALLLPLGLAFARMLLLVFLSRPLEYAEYDKYLVRQKGVFFFALALSGVLTVGLAVFLLFGRQAEKAREWAAFLASAFCFGCIFFAFRQYHALIQSIIIDEPSGVRYDI